MERTDHKHLGQLITYASGLKAVTIVWIANPFTDEHRAALDWLNEITDGRFNFFGLEVELWRIGDSNVAPKFNIVSQPNDWSKTVSEGVARVEKEDLTETKQLQLDFWTQFREYAAVHGKAIRTTKALPHHWMNLSIGRSGFGLTAIASLWNNETQSYSPNEIRAQVKLRKGGAKTYFEKLLEQKEQIEFELGFPVAWHNDPEKVSCKIVTSKSVDLSNRSDWNNQFEWLVKQLDALHRVFWHRIRDL